VKEPVEDNDWHERQDAETLAKYADVLARLGRTTEAEALIRCGIRALTNASDSDWRLLSDLKSTLARMLEMQGKFAESLELLSAVHSETKRKLGPDNPTTIAIAQLLAGHPMTTATTQRLAPTTTSN